MIVNKLEDEDIKLYSLGIEKKYLGTAIEYEDKTITFIYFYYPNLIRLYIINGNAHTSHIAQVSPYVNKICTLDNTAAKRMKRFINSKLRYSKLIFYLPPIFFREASFVLLQKGFIKKLELLFDKYKKDLKNGINYPYV